MNNVNAVNVIDGNQYLVSMSNNTDDSQGNSFDDVFTSENKNLEDIFQNAAQEYGVPVKLLKAVAQAESDFDTNAVSSCGASGIMQLMPSTAQSLGVEDVFDAEQNVNGGAKMLAGLLNDYDGDVSLALAAYNAGSGNVAKYGGVPPFKETQNYIKKISDIMGGDLEVDTSDISIEKNAAAADTQTSAASTSTTKTGKAQVPVTIITDGDSRSPANEIFSYETYLRFLEMYEKLAESTQQSDENDKSDNDQNQSQQNNIYQMQQAMFNAKAVSLLNL